MRYQAILFDMDGTLLPMDEEKFLEYYLTELAAVMAPYGVDPRTMASKLVKGLSFAGEVLDVDAYTGGYNLQIAWSTAQAAARAL